MRIVGSILQLIFKFMRDKLTCVIVTECDTCGDIAIDFTSASASSTSRNLATISSGGWRLRIIARFIWNSLWRDQTRWFLAFTKSREVQSGQWLEACLCPRVFVRSSLWMWRMIYTSNWRTIWWDIRMPKWCWRQLISVGNKWMIMIERSAIIWGTWFFSKHIRMPKNFFFAFRCWHFDIWMFLFVNSMKGKAISSIS